MIGSGLCLGLGFGNPASPGWGLGWVCLGTVCGFAPLFPAGVCGVCGWAWVSACTPHFLVRVLGRAWLCARSACTPPFPVLVCGVGVRAGVWVPAAPRHSLGGCWGVCVLVYPSRAVSCTSWLGVLCGGVWLGLGCCRATPLLAGVLGRVCVCVRAPLVPRLSWLGCAVWVCMLGSGFSCAPPLLVGLFGCVCGRACAPPAPALLGGRPVARGCAGVAVGGVCPPPLLPFGFFLFFFGGGIVTCRVMVLWCRSLVVPVLGLVVSVRPSLLFRAALFFFFRPSLVCVRLFWVSLLSLGCCSRLGVAGFGWVVWRCPFGGSCLLCHLGGGFGRLLRCWWAVWWLWAVLAPPPLVFFWGGVCLFLPLPSLGWRTHWSASSVVFRFAVGGCVLPGRAPAPWVGWVMYTLGSAPLTAGSGCGSAGWALAPGGFMWPSVRGAWVFRVLSGPQCRF